jgi:hypothetical protein
MSHVFFRWLYKKIYAIDACFKLSMKGSGKKRSENDPELASGFGVFVNEHDYQDTLRKNANVAEVCVITVVSSEVAEVSFATGQCPYMRHRLSCSD